MSGSKCKSSGDVAGTAVLFKVLYCKIKNVFFTFYICLFFMYCLCEKSYKPITVQYYIADCISWVPRLNFVELSNKLDLQTRSQNVTCLYVEGLTVLVYKLLSILSSSVISKLEWAIFLRRMF